MIEVAFAFAKNTFNCAVAEKNSQIPISHLLLFQAQVNKSHQQPKLPINVPLRDKTRSCEILTGRLISRENCTIEKLSFIVADISSHCTSK